MKRIVFAMTFVTAMCVAVNAQSAFSFSLGYAGGGFSIGIASPAIVVSEPVVVYAQPVIYTTPTYTYGGYNGYNSYQPYSYPSYGYSSYSYPSYGSCYGAYGYNTYSYPSYRPAVYRTPVYKTVVRKDIDKVFPNGREVRKDIVRKKSW